jgi:dTDP-4-amino-4,6-dideoxygalactose transaminase
VNERIPITKPVFGEEELRAVQLPLETGWVVQGPHVAEFERLFGEYVGAPHATAASSCTTALHLAVRALGLKAGDEVIVPAFTWVSTANVIEYERARPVFCDIDLVTFNLDVAQLESLVTDRTVGIVPVHLFGLCADMDAVLEFAGKHGLWVVEDAACAFGGWIGDRHAGTMGDAGAFSFHPRKSITTGEGGMLTTAKPQLDSLSRSLRDHGASRSDLDRHESSGSYLLSDYTRVGFNYRMTDFQGALGVAQMHRADEVLTGRRRVAALYDELLSKLEWLQPPATPDGFVHGYQSYVCLYAPEEPTLANLGELHETRNAVMTLLEEQGIATRQGTHAAALQTVYRDKYGFREEDFPCAVIGDRLTIALPLYPQLTEADQHRVVDALAAAHSSTASPKPVRPFPSPL